MYRNISVARCLLLASTAICAVGNSSVSNAAELGYVYAYFKGPWPTGGESGVFMSYSSDGLHFSSLNNGNAVLVPPTEFSDAEDQMRDPSVVYGPDGLFHMVWTSGITTKTIGYSSSPNLKDWSTPTLVPIWNSSVNVNNTWAPEIFYDEVSQHYQIVFSSNLNNGDHKLYATTTTDFSSYSSPQLSYYNGNTVIDGMIVKDAANDRYLMVLKDERNGAKNVTLATSSAAQGPWTTDNPVIVGPGSAIEPNVTEGPSLVKIGETWHLYYDAYGAGYLGVATSTDLVSWVNLTGQSTMPVGPNAHHGTVFAAPNDSIAFELPFMRSDFNNDDLIDSADWTIFLSCNLADLSQLTKVEQAARGDLNGDGRNDFLDFRLFQQDFDVFNGAGAFQAAVSVVPVPEPSTAGALLTALICVCGRSRQLQRRNCPAAIWQTLILLTFVISATGCGASSGGVAHLQGQVTLNGKQIPADAKAFVMFVPEGNPSKAVSVPVANGKYDSPNTPVGKVSVQFEISREIGPSKTSQRTGQSYRETENLVPGKYATGISLDVTGDNSSQDFDLSK